ncbi:MAG: PaaI family thioesterase [Burkholderiaceae bacterium]|nr:PaaI family thioesterase [Burkholderiaceae bacterium]
MSDDTPPGDHALDAIPFMRALGARLLRADGGEAELQLALEPRHMNSWGVGHGGVVMSLLDVAMARAGRSLEADAPGTVTVEMKTSFFAPARGRLRAVGRVLHRSVTMAYCEAELFSVEGERETLAAKALGTFKFLRRLDAAPRIR